MPEQLRPGRASTNTRLELVVLMEIKCDQVRCSPYVAPDLVGIGDAPATNERTHRSTPRVETWRIPQRMARLTTPNLAQAGCR